MRLTLFAPRGAVAPLPLTFVYSGALLGCWSVKVGAGQAIAESRAQLLKLSVELTRVTRTRGNARDRQSGVERDERQLSHPLVANPRASAAFYAMSSSLFPVSMFELAREQEIIRLT